LTVQSPFESKESRAEKVSAIIQMSKRGNVATRKGTRIDGNNKATLVAEGNDSDGANAEDAEENPLKEINPKLFNELT